MDATLLLAAACTRYAYRQHSTTTQKSAFKSRVFANTSIRRLDGYGGARIVAPNLQAPLRERCAHSRLDARSQPRPQAAPPRSRLRAARPVTRQRATAREPGTAPAPGRPRKRRQTLPRRRRAEAASRAHTRARQGWAPARPPRPARPVLARRFIDAFERRGRPHRGQGHRDGRRHATPSLDYLQDKGRLRRETPDAIIALDLDKFRKRSRRNLWESGGTGRGHGGEAG